MTFNQARLLAEVASHTESLVGLIDRDGGTAGEIGNSPALFAALAQALRGWPAATISWIDRAGTRMTITFCVPTRFGYIPGLSTLRGYLYVGIEGYGCHPFDIIDEHIAPEYVGEKLMGGRVSRTTIELATLISGVRRELWKL